MRHYINLTLLYSLLPGQAFTTVGRFDLSWPEQQYKCTLSQVVTGGLLGTLQLVNCFWFFLILRIAYRLVAAGTKKDERSDDEEEDPGNDAETPTGEKPLVLVNGEPVGASSAIDNTTTKRR